MRTIGGTSECDTCCVSPKMTREIGRQKKADITTFLINTWGVWQRQFKEFRRATSTLNRAFQKRCRALTQPTFYIYEKG